MRQMRNVFEAILKYGHDEDFAPRRTMIFADRSAGRFAREARRAGGARPCAASRCGTPKIGPTTAA